MDIWKSTKSLVKTVSETYRDPVGTVVDGFDRITNFNEDLEKLRSILKNISVPAKKLGQEILISEEDQKVARKLLELLREGSEVEHTSSQSARKALDRYRKSKRMTNFINELRRFAGVELQLDMYGDIKNIHREASEIKNEVVGIKLGMDEFRLNLGEMRQLLYSQTRCAFNEMPKEERVSLQLVNYSMLPQLPSLTVGVEGPLQELKSLLFHKHGIVGVCGPGGCGKTTLITKLCHDEEVKGKFAHITFLTVSSTPNMLAIIKRLWAELINDNKPEFLSEKDAEMQLKHHLMQVPQQVLVVLDDVWSEDVVEKLVVQNTNIKTIVTSRSKLNNLRSDHSIYTLKELGSDDSMKLFRHHALVSDQALVPLEHPNREKPMNSLVKEVVDGCKGHALTLVVIAASLKDKPIKQWRMTAQLLREGGSKFFDRFNEIFGCLDTSIKLLSEEFRQCFTDLSLFHEDAKIPASTLIDIWVELRGFTEDEAYVTLMELSSLHLINLHERTSDDPGETYGSLCNLYVIQHDLLRDMAMYYSRKNEQRLIMNLTDDLRNSRGQLGNEACPARIVSIRTGEMERSSWSNLQLHQTEVLILIFSANIYFLPPFLERMENLKVLIMSNCGSNPAKLFDVPQSHTLKNLRRARLENILLPPISTFRQPFEGLEKVSLVSCNARECPSDIHFYLSPILPAIKELEISYCSDLIELHPGVCSFRKLEKLSITSCPDLIRLPGSLGTVANLEVLRLQACTSLESIPDSVSMLLKLKFLDISHCSAIENLPDRFGELCNLERLDMRRVNIKHLPASPSSLIGLQTVICDEDNVKLWYPFRSRVQLCVPKEDFNLNWLY